MVSLATFHSLTIATWLVIPFWYDLALFAYDTTLLCHHPTCRDYRNHRNQRNCRFHYQYHLHSLYFGYRYFLFYNSRIRKIDSSFVFACPRNDISAISSLFFSLDHRATHAFLSPFLFSFTTTIIMLTIIIMMLFYYYNHYKTYNHVI